MLLPEVVSLANHYAAALVDSAEMLESMGLIVEAFGTGAVVVRAIPALLGTPDVKQLMTDIAEELVELGGSTSLEDRINNVLATVSCHGSVRAGRSLEWRRDERAFAGYGSYPAIWAMQSWSPYMDSAIAC